VRRWGIDFHNHGSENGDHPHAQVIRAVGYTVLHGVTKSADNLPLRVFHSSIHSFIYSHSMDPYKVIETYGCRNSQQSRLYTQINTY